MGHKSEVAQHIGRSLIMAEEENIEKHEGTEEIYRSRTEREYVEGRDDIK